MKRLAYLSVFLFAVAGVAAVGFFLQAGLIAQYQSEARAVLLGEEESDEPAFEALLPLVDPRIQRAPSIQLYCLVAGIVAACGGVVCLSWRRSILFLLKVEDGAVTVVAGKVSRQFIDEVSDCCKEARIQEAEIWARKLGRVRLGFSRSLPKNVQQRIRNVWVRMTVGQGAPLASRV